MDKLEEEIVNQYREGFFSVQQIADNLKLTPSKIRYILDRLCVKRRNISDAIRHLNTTKFKKGGFEIKSNLSQDEEMLKIAGTMLYWGEGTKEGNTVVLSNSNPDMVVLFLKFLREICKISENRIRALLHIYENQDESELLDFWSKKIRIPQSQFSKSFLHKKRSGSYRKISPFGTLSLRYSDKELLRLINLWTKEYSEKL